MSISLTQLQDTLSRVLEPGLFNDYCPNGLQIEGKSEIKKIVTGVTASQSFIDAALERGADAVLVHHGYFWKGEKEVLTGIKGKRIKTLMRNDVSLLAYHLPLDAHAELGNNAQLAKLLDIDVEAGMDASSRPIGNVGVLKLEQTATVLATHIEKKLQRKPIVLGEEDRLIKRVAWCTGSAQSMIEKAAQLRVDCFISGEVSEQTLHLAQELDITYIGAGHHATERYGVKALGEFLAKELGVEVEFIDIDNPV